MLILLCPNCEEYVEIQEINCGIFRHAIYKNTLSQVNSHLPENECKNLLENNQVFGCCKPFKLENIEGELKAVKCDYI